MQPINGSNSSFRPQPLTLSAEARSKLIDVCISNGANSISPSRDSVHIGVSTDAEKERVLQGLLTLDNISKGGDGNYYYCDFQIVIEVHGNIVFVGSN